MKIILNFGHGVQWIWIFQIAYSFKFGEDIPIIDLLKIWSRRFARAIENIIIKSFIGSAKTLEIELQSLPMTFRIQELALTKRNKIQKEQVGCKGEWRISSFLQERKALKPTRLPPSKMYVRYMYFP